MGIASPQVAHTRLTVNDEYWGVYTLVEDITKPFLEARLGDKEGNLFSYEYTFAYDFSYRGANSNAYVPVPFEPETNEDTLDAAGLIAFIRTINEAPDATFVAAISPFLDVTRFLTHVAVENAIAENDGILGFEGMNNFYLYQYAGQNRFVFIPWDKDTTFVSSEFPLAQSRGHQRPGAPPAGRPRADDGLPGRGEAGGGGGGEPGLPAAPHRGHVRRSSGTRPSRTGTSPTPTRNSRSASRG